MEPASVCRHPGTIALLYDTVTRTTLGAMTELWEKDVKVFLTLTSLARRHTEYTRGAASHKEYSTVLDAGRKYYPDLTEAELLRLAQDVETIRNKKIVSVALKVPPLCKIDSRDQVSEDIFRVTLECGHERTIKLLPFQRTVRCRECLRSENKGVGANLRSVSVRK